MAQRYQVEWGVRHAIGEPFEHVCNGSMVGSKAAMEGLFNQLTRSFGAEPGGGHAKLSWGNARTTWEDGGRRYWVTITAI